MPKPAKCMLLLWLVGCCYPPVADSAETPSPNRLVEERELQETYPGYRGVDADYVHAGKEALDRWQDWKFGLRIHWGVYSLLPDGYGDTLATGPRWKCSWPLARHDLAWQGAYHQLWRFFLPGDYDPDRWAEMMVRCGFKFFVITTKHHDGFSLYDTKTKVRRRFVYDGPQAGSIEECDLHYSIMENAYGKDLIGPLVEAGRRHGLGVGLYFSHIDWYDADFRMDRWNPLRDEDYSPETDPEGWARFTARHREQICELLTNYGRVDMLSLDMHLAPEGKSIAALDGPARLAVVDTVKMARRLQPQVLLRHRGIGPYGDYSTPESHIPEGPDAWNEGQGYALSDKPWQVIHPLGNYFAWEANEKTLRPKEWIVESLIDVVAKGGNFMVGVGPNADGQFHPAVIERLEYAGQWLRVCGEAIYATRPWEYWKEGDMIRYTRSKDGKYVYAIALDWPGRSLTLTHPRAKAGSQIVLLGVKKALDWHQDSSHLIITIPDHLQDEAARRCPQAWVFRIELQPD